MKSKSVPVKTNPETRWEAQWLWQFENIKRYRKKFPQAWPELVTEFPPGNKLGQWVQRQRLLKTQKQMSKERLDLLQKQGFPWEKTDAREMHWMQQYQHLQQYRKKNSMEWPFAREEFPKGNLLGLWVWRQRQLFQKEQLPKERLELLKKIKFPLELPDYWELHFNTLKDFRKKNPDTWPKAREEFPKGNRLGLWLHLQRCAYKEKKLTADRIKKLSQIGVVWFVKDANWQKNYETLKDFKKKHPNLWPLGTVASENNTVLVAWLNSQRQQRRHGRLNSEREALLTKIGVKW